MRDVFSTTHATLGTYVQRNAEEGKTYEATLGMALADPGRHYVIYGPSKVGKTQLWKAVLGRDAVPVPCVGINDIEHLYSHAIYRLKKPHLTEEKITESTKKGKKTEVSANLGIEESVALGFSRSSTDDESVEEERKFAYQSQPNNAMAVAELFSKNKRCLVFENYHRLDSGLLERLALDLREFSDQGVSVFLVGIPEDPSELFDYNKELSGRVEYLNVKWWDTKDLKNIALAGGKVLNVSFTHRSLDLLSKEACGSPLLMQQFCLLACLASKIVGFCDDSLDARVNISDIELRQGIEKWVAKTLKPYEDCKSIIDETAVTAGLPSSFVELLFDEFKKEDSRMSFSFSDIGLDKVAYESICEFIETLERNRRTKGLLAMQPKKKEISVIDPNFFVYGRWLL